MAPLVRKAVYVQAPDITSTPEAKPKATKSVSLLFLGSRDQEGYLFSGSKMLQNLAHTGPVPTSTSPGS